jgi:hypothetical protein
MAANTIPTPDFRVNQTKAEKSAIESCATATLKQWFGNLLRRVFEGHEEYLGATPD